MDAHLLYNEGYNFFCAACLINYINRMSKLRLGVHRKNERRKKYGYYCVRIPLESVSVLKVTVPLELLSLKVSLPLPAFYESPASSLSLLHNRINVAGILPQGKF